VTTRREAEREITVRERQSEREREKKIEVEIEREMDKEEEMRGRCQHRQFVVLMYGRLQSEIEIEVAEKVYFHTKPRPSCIRLIDVAFITSKEVV